MNSPGPCTTSQCADVATCESVWSCARGRARLDCHLRRHEEQRFELHVVRNGRLFGSYQFAERVTAIVFAGRLRHTFEANGWIAG